VISIVVLSLVILCYSLSFVVHLLFGICKTSFHMKNIESKNLVIKIQFIITLFKA